MAVLVRLAKVYLEKSKVHYHLEPWAANGVGFFLEVRGKYELYSKLGRLYRGLKMKKGVIKEGSLQGILGG